MRHFTEENPPTEEERQEIYEGLKKVVKEAKMENFSKKIEYLKYLLRWNLLPAIILFGGIYLAIEGRHTELGFYLSIIGVFSLALWASHNRPESYGHYIKKIEREEAEADEIEEIKKRYFNE